MIENLADFPSVKSKMGVGEMHERDSSNEDKHPGVVSLALGFKRIIAQFVAVWGIVDVVLFFK